MLVIDQNLGPEKLKGFFIDHLNRIYSAKSHLAICLPEIKNLAKFKDLQNAIGETFSSVEKQIARMHEIYNLLNAKISVETYNGLTKIIEDAFIAIKQSEDPVLCDMSILFLLQNIESVEMTSFQVLQLAAVKLKNEQVKQLLKENFEEAKSEKILFQVLTAKYITG